MKKVYLTFDDGPSETTPEILDLLKRYHIPAIFFVLTEAALRYPDIIKREIAEGHSIQLHGFDHDSFSKLSDEETHMVIGLALDDLKKEFNIIPRIMRPPYGTVTSELLDSLKMRKMKLMLWDVGGESVKDWHKKNPAGKAKTIMQQLKLKDENILLLHDGNKGRAKYPGCTVEILKIILPKLIKEYDFTLPEFVIETTK